ncbi:hypothetical protein NP493_368g02044 [Ridgeia piscesae]|uniref:Uncharacterized protein n=1 Tax=Ridgeia piscesae TaxID=27915 RepID=A0AAD9L2B3_RIDPI|nr:hypothetical protein NP493_368g02044 [Ridgeia piscesae]
MYVTHSDWHILVYYTFKLAQSCVLHIQIGTVVCITHIDWHIHVHHTYRLAQSSNSHCIDTSILITYIICTVTLTILQYHTQHTSVLHIGILVHTIISIYVIAIAAY